MKQNITNKVKLSRYFYSLILFIICVNISFSQTITKKYEKEINITSDSRIFIEGPGSLPFQSEGKLKVNTLNGYALEPRDNEGLAAFVANKLDIKTSSDNLLKQVVTVKVIPHEKSKSDAKALVEAIKLTISKEGTQYRIDNNVNIQRLSFKNGFFQGTKNIVVLDDGSMYNIRSIEISAIITVPEDITLSLTSKYIDVNIDDFGGILDINADKSTVKLNNINKLNGRFNSCKVNFNSIENASIIAYNSTIKGNSVNLFDLGTEEIVLKESLFGNTKKASLSTYKINTVDIMNIIETSNDEFKIEEIGSINVKSSHFSNYEIKRLKKELFIKAKNGNITIDTIANDVTKLEIDNQISTINLGVQELDSYLINFPKLIYSEKIIPIDAKEISQGEEIAFSKGIINDKGLISISCENCKIDIKD